MENLKNVKHQTSKEKAFPMDTSSPIRHRFTVEIPRGKFVEISSIFKGESMWKLWHWSNVEISTWIRISKSMKYRWVFHIVSMWNRLNCFNHCFLSIIFEHFLLWKPINYEYRIFVFFKITLTKIIMPMFINKNDIYLLENNTKQSF